VGDDARETDRAGDLLVLVDGVLVAAGVRVGDQSARVTR
jgi:hypothetical protein